MKQQVSAQLGFRVTLRLALILLVLLGVIACTAETRQLFFDIQPPTAEELAAKARQSDQIYGGVTNESGMAAGLTGKPWSTNDNLPPPAIEALETWEEVEAAMPKDDEGDVDWATALRQGLIRPRVGANPRDALATVFQWDFIIPALDMEEDDEDEEEAEMDAGEEHDQEVAAVNDSAEAVEDDEENSEDHEDDAFFPHSTHTQWLNCRNCHMPIYKFRRNFTTMKEKKKGVSCGICHGKVAFSLKTCQRCHPNS